MVSPPSFRLFNPKMLVIQPMDLLLILGWSCLATPFLAVLGFAAFSANGRSCGTRL